MKSFIAFVVLFTSAAILRAQSTGFTYQGRLSANGASANGVYDFEFKLRDVQTNQVGPTLNIAPVTVSEGTFLVTLDFGAGVFTGAPRWLEIAVRPNGSATPHFVLAPWQRIGSTPYAVQALMASNVLGAISESQLPSTIARLNANQIVTGTFAFSNLFGAPFVIGNTNTNRVVWLNADLLDGNDSSAFARSNHTHSTLDITSGSLNDARLSANVPLLNRAQVFSSSNTFAGVVIATNLSNTFAGNGAGLTGLNAAAVAGTLPASSLPGGVAQLGSNQTFTGAVTFGPAVGAPFRVGNATLVTNLHADLLDGLSAGAFWNINGNAGTSSANFLGTTDNQPLELRANNQRVWRVIPTASAPNLVGGSALNSAAANSIGGVIGGGSGNAVSNNYATISGGQNNIATNLGAVVPGGSGNVAGGANSFAAGSGARALHSTTLVWADGSSATPFASTAPNQFVLRAAGGVGIGTNAPQAPLHVVGLVQSDAVKITGGAAAGAVLTSDATGVASWQQPSTRVGINATSPNLLSGHGNNMVGPGVAGATIAGGGTATASNFAGANFSTVSGGRANAITGAYGVIGGGDSNRASGAWATIAGGSNNFASGGWSTVAGGASNNASGSQSFVGSGQLNVAAGQNSVVSGGGQNRSVGNFSSIGGGLNNFNSGLAAVVAGGQDNAATNTYATVPGGSGNIAGGSYSLAAGRGAHALHSGSAVWADASSATPFASSANHQFLIRAIGGVGINTSSPLAPLDVAGHARVSSGGTLTLDANDLNAGSLDVGGLRFGNGAGEGVASRRQPGPNQFGLDLYTLFAPRLSITQGGNVGVGTTAPQQLLSVAGGIALDQGDSNVGDVVNSLRFGSLSGEAIASKRTVGGNRYGLDFYTGGNQRMTILNNGRVGIGTRAPNDQFEVVAPDAAIRVKNINDGGLGGFLENTFGSLQLGMFAESNAVGQIAGATKRALFGMAPDGRVGSLVNVLTTPSDESFRNLLDDGNGNMRVSDGGSVQFGSNMRQMLNLWDTSYGLGIQAFTLYYRSDEYFAWYRGGSHANGQFDPGGGNELMRLTSSALTVNGVVASSSDRNLKADIVPVNARAVLDRVLGLNIAHWRYTNDASRARHIGPMAQDFHAAFNVGSDDKHIAGVDADGVALAAIQGLHAVVEEREARIAALEKRVVALEQLSQAGSRLGEKLAALEKQLRSLSAARRWATESISSGNGEAGTE